MNWAYIVHNNFINCKTKLQQLESQAAVVSHTAVVS